MRRPVWLKTTTEWNQQLSSHLPIRNLTAKPQEPHWSRVSARVVNFNHHVVFFSHPFGQLGKRPAASTVLVSG
jgi:hypothetical protein